MNEINNLVCLRLCGQSQGETPPAPPASAMRISGGGGLTEHLASATAETSAARTGYALTG